MDLCIKIKKGHKIEKLLIGRTLHIAYSRSCLQVRFCLYSWIFVPKVLVVLGFPWTENECLSIFLFLPDLWNFYSWLDWMNDFFALGWFYHHHHHHYHFFLYMFSFINLMALISRWWINDLGVVDWRTDNFCVEEGLNVMDYYCGLFHWKFEMFIYLPLCIGIQLIMNSNRQKGKRKSLFINLQLYGEAIFFPHSWWQYILQEIIYLQFFISF